MPAAGFILNEGMAISCNIIQDIFVTFATYMKIFVIIFSFFLLAISLIPCDDSAPSRADSYQAVAYDQNGGHQNHHNAEGDGCSPLCSCQCCNVQVPVTAWQIFFEEIEFIQPESVYIRHHSDLFPNTLLQPPILA